VPLVKAHLLKVYPIHHSSSRFGISVSSVWCYDSFRFVPIEFLVPKLLLVNGTKIDLKIDPNARSSLGQVKRRADMEVPSESFHRSSWDSRTCYPRRAFNQGFTDDLEDGCSGSKSSSQQMNLS